ncbi:MAG: hypothetical protein ACOH2H_06095 [Cypionkella sp.]
MKTERRWLKSAIVASAEPQVALPWQRGSRRRPAAMKALPAVSALTTKLTAMAAR